MEKGIKEKKRSLCDIILLCASVWVPEIFTGADVNATMKHLSFFKKIRWA